MSGILDRNEEYEKLGKDKSLVVTALALERMWMPYWIDVHKTNYTEEERTRNIEITEELMQMIWGRIERGHALPGDYDRFHELLTLMNDTLFDPEATVYGAELDVNAEQFLEAIFRCAENFFVDEEFVSGICDEVVEGVLDKMIDKLEIYLLYSIYEGSFEIKKKNEELSDDIIEHHPALVDEVFRVKADKALAQNYPHNMEEILKRKEEYHKLNVFDFKPPEEYGFEVEVIK